MVLIQFVCKKCDRYWVESVHSPDELQFYPMRCERCGKTATIDYEVIA